MWNLPGNFTYDGFAVGIICYFLEYCEPGLKMTIIQARYNILEIIIQLENSSKNWIGDKEKNKMYTVKQKL